MNCYGSGQNHYSERLKWMFSVLKTLISSVCDSSAKGSIRTLSSGLLSMGI